MSDQDVHDQPDDDVEGHRFLTPDRAQERAEAARLERDRRRAEEAAAERDS